MPCTKLVPTFASYPPVYLLLEVTWSQTVFQCLWPRHDPTAAHELEQGAYGDLTPFPWACQGDRFDICCLSRFLRLPSMVMVLWFELLYTLGPGTSADIPTSSPCALFQPELGEQWSPNIFFLECNCRSLLAESCLQSDQRLSKLPFPFSLSPRPKVSTWTWAACGGLSIHSFPQCDLEGTAKGWSNQVTFSFWLFVSTFMKTEAGAEKKI